MPLREHLAELRRRLLICGIVIVAGAVVSWIYLYDPLLRELIRPLKEVAEERGRLASLNFGDLTSSFNLKIKLSMYLGVVAASPVWLYQLWAFIVPGLTKREKRYSLGFVAAAVPLFLAGIGVAWLVLPNAVKFLTEFAPEDTTNLIDAQAYLTFASRLMMVFGIAFVIPLLLVALNLVGMVRGITLAKGWRVAVFLVFLFAAIASPSPDAGSMLTLAFPMVGLYMLAVAIALLVDRRRDKVAARAGFGPLADDEATPLDELTGGGTAAQPLDYTPEPLDDDSRPDKP